MGAEIQTLRRRLEEETERLAAVDQEVAGTFSAWHRASLNAEALRQEHRSTARQLGDYHTELVSKRRAVEELEAKVTVLVVPSLPEGHACGLSIQDSALASPSVIAE